MGDLTITSLPTDLTTTPASLSGASSAGKSDAALEKVAKDFEAVFLHKVLEEMRRSIPQSGLTEEEGSEQIQSIFWYNLAQDVGEKGGLGLWKQLYRQMASASATPPQPQVEHLQ